MADAGEEMGRIRSWRIPAPSRDRAAPASACRTLGWSDVAPTAHPLIESRAYFLTTSLPASTNGTTTDHTARSPAIGATTYDRWRFHPRRSQRYGIAR